MEIIHENIKIRKKGNYWKCPHDCHDERFPKPKWKTEKAFQRHLNNCHLMPSKIKEGEEKEQKKKAIIKKRIDKINELKDGFLKSINIYLGKEINYVKEVTVKPTHENRNGRMVKVRHEPVLKYIPITEQVKSITFKEPSENITLDLDYMKNLLRINNDITFFSIEQSEKEAIEKAKIKTISDTEYRNISSLYR